MYVPTCSIVLVRSLPVTRYTSFLSQKLANQREKSTLILPRLGVNVPSTSNIYLGTSQSLHFIFQSKLLFLQRNDILVWRLLSLQCLNTSMQVFMLSF